MLLELSIEDYILIERAEISFRSGLNMITGETGAGKSMVIGALELLLGKKSSVSDIRADAEKAVITATFDADEAICREFDLSDENIILTREIRRDGKTVAKLNYRSVPLQIMKRVAQSLVRIHGQNEQLELFNREYQLKMLDTFAKHDLSDAVHSAYDALKQVQSELMTLRSDEMRSGAKMDFLKFQTEEIRNAQLREGEDDELEKEYSYLMSIEKIAEAAGFAANWLSGEDFSAVNSISDIARQLRKVSELSAETKELYEYASEAERVLGDFSAATEHFLDTLNRDDQRIAEIERRLDLINSLKRKYGGGISEIHAKAESMEAEIFALEHIESEREKAEERYQVLLTEYMGIAKKLSDARRDAAERLEKRLLSELSELNMPESKIKIALTEGEIGASGTDDIDFRISTAVGHELQSLKKVVSGGELSRIMLAIQVVIRGEQTMLFDEVDAGISGKTAAVVGEKLAELSAEGQLICITHLPQIAVFADVHILIEKSSDESRTVTRVKVLKEAEKKNEIMRLVGGASTSEITLRHSEEMLKDAAKKKAKMERRI